MNLSIKTSKGIYKYKYQIVYEGIKILNPAIAEENLLLFNKVAVENKLHYGMVYGTLLGAIREHDFIAHDEDIDLFILKEDLEHFKSMLFELRDIGFDVIRYDRRDGLCSIMRNGEYIDIYIFSKLIPGVRETLGDPIPEKYVTELAPIKFKGIDILAAKDAEEAMIFNYGGNWNVPIVTKPYSMSWFMKMKIKFEWWLYFYMPDFIFNPLMQYRAQKKMKRYNMRVDRLNNILGKSVLECIPINCYKIK